MERSLEEPLAPEDIRRLLRNSGLLPRQRLRVIRARPTKIDRVRIFASQVLEMFAALVRPPVRT